MARRILLADDSVTAQNMGRRILADAGYEVVTVNNGSAALKKIAESTPDLIVLDVYMPGYGGLEVCQRIKESAETARIPVLLTVGKLEPFKPDEARRVGADAFIVKPFEATELLTALTKLEDRIVAQPQPQKSVRFARALAAVEQSEQFGDKETGWKSRLTIPDPSGTAKAAEAEVSDVVASAPLHLERSPDGVAAEPASAFERPIPAGLPADITPEEIAAITAAAAAFGGRAEPSAVPDTAPSSPAAGQEGASRETAAVPSSEAETPPVTLTAPLEAAPESQPEVPAETTPAATAAIAVAEVAKEEQEQPVAAEVPQVAVPAEASASTAAAQISETARPSSGDAEVMAAIASLAPSPGQAGEACQPVSQCLHQTGGEAPTLVHAEAVGAGAGIPGPRWIAEAVAVTPEESTLALEPEMERAHAASLAAEAVKAEAGRNDLAHATEVPHPAPVETMEPAAAVASITEAVAVAESLPTPIAAALSPMESSPRVNQEPAVAKHEAVFAAAASAGSTAGPVFSPEAASSPAVLPEPAESQPAAGAEGAPRREAELAAAWQNWKQIRESFVGAQPAELPPADPGHVAASSGGEQIAAPAQAASGETVAPTAEVAPAASEAGEESGAIASIVDSMLAELRPKLVEEIAKKMNSEKKEKDREKKKKK